MHATVRSTTASDPAYSVLLVDDDPTARRITRRALSGSAKAITLDEVSQSELAVDRAIAMQPDLILLDLMMPGIDGLEVCRRLRQSEATRDIPVLMLTAHFDPSTKLRAFECGADGFLARPVDRLELRTRVEAVLDAARPRRLREAEHSASQLLETAPVGAIVLDPSGAVQQCNSKAQELLGGQPHLVETLRSLDAERLRQAIATAMDSDEPTTLQLVQAVSPPRVLEVALRRIRFGGSDRVVLFILDVTASADLTAEWLQASRAREDELLLAGVTHDLASLLQVGYVQQGLLASIIESPEGAISVAEDLQATFDGMRGLLTDMRSLQRDGRPQGAITAGVALSELFRRLARRVRYLVTPNIQVQIPVVAAQSDLDVTIPWLEDILLNLITNARDAIGTARGTITVGAERVGASVVIRVSDDGPGIPEEIVAKLGTPFMTTKAPGKGTGLGLWMIKERASAAGGHFAVMRNGAQGTTATLTYTATPSLESSAD
jgi:DNA-binding response OmpR family regulator/two-component sensor histidine kinase